MVVGIVMIVAGLVVYFGMSAVGAARSGPNPTPGSGDVPAWMSGIAALGGLLAAVGAVVVVVSLF